MAPEAVARKPKQIDTSTETTYRLSEIGKLLPSNPGYHTVYLWCTVGMPHAKQGLRTTRTRKKKRTVRLETVVVSGVLCTTVEAYHRMVAEVNR